MSSEHRKETERASVSPHYTRKVLVIGNCQARPVASLLGEIDGFEIMPPIILHLAKDDEKQKHLAMIEAADVVLAQATSPSFPLKHLRSQVLREQAPGKILVWPNIFFAGQQPHQCYVSLPGWRCLGPMETNHDLRVLRAWFQERHNIDFAAWIEHPEFEEFVARKSLQELQVREEDCDVHISDLIDQKYKTEQLFFLFNHPRLRLLIQLTNRILAKTGSTHQLLMPDVVAREPLGRYTPPGLDMEAGAGSYLGSEVKLENDGRIVSGAPYQYSLEALRTAYFNCYDHQQERLLSDTLRLTPNSQNYIAELDS
jgi:hypothetical protein